MRIVLASEVQIACNSIIFHYTALNVSVVCAHVTSAPAAETAADATSAASGMYLIVSRHDCNLHDYLTGQ